MLSNLAGQTLGRYKLVETIGAGSLATVYKSFQPNLERWVAVKVIRLDNKEMLARFQREAKAVAQLRHRNILIVNEYGEDGDWAFIVMEYVPGGTLKDRLQGAAMDWAKAIKLVLPIAEALHYAHSLGIVHRDLKPSNILMPREDWPLLADFGMAKLLDTDEALTRVGTLIGTPAYIAPEQARGAEIDHRVDIYALGVVLFELVTGRLPFDYQNINRILLAHIADRPPSPRQFNPDCPPDLEKAILTALQKSPDERFADMKQMADALNDILASTQKRLEPKPELGVETLVLDDLAGTAKPPQRSEQAQTLNAQIFFPDKKASLPIPPQAQVIIGRTHGTTVADIDLGPYGGADSGVSRHHARLIRQEEGWLIEDLGSLNGTFVNDLKIKPGHPVPLKDGDRVRCSHLTFLFKISTTA